MLWETYRQTYRICWLWIRRTGQTENINRNSEAETKQFQYRQYKEAYICDSCRLRCAIPQNSANPREIHNDRHNDRGGQLASITVKIYYIWKSPNRVSIMNSIHTMAACDNNNQQTTQSIADYLAQLLKDRKQLAAFPQVFVHVERLLDEGMYNNYQTLFSLHRTQSYLLCFTLIIFVKFAVVLLCNFCVTFFFFS